MSYGDLITRSWTIFWRYRYLWLLGALGGGMGTANGFGGRIGNVGPPPGEVNRWVSDHAGLLIGLGILAFLVFLVYLFVLVNIALGALVRAAAEHDAERPFGLGVAWQAGLHTFLRVLGLRVVAALCAIAGLAVFAAAGFLVIALGIASANDRLGGGVALAILIGIALIGILIIVSIAYSLVVTLATIALVLEQRGIFSSFGRGIRLLSDRMGRVLLIWLLSIPISIVIGVAIGVLAVILALPLLAVGFGVYAGLGTQAALTAGLVLAVLFGILVVLLSGAAQSYLTIYWTLAFRRLELDAPRVPAYAYGQPPTPA